MPSSYRHAHPRHDAGDDDGYGASLYDNGRPSDGGRGGLLAYAASMGQRDVLNGRDGPTASSPAASSPSSTVPRSYKQHLQQRAAYAAHASTSASGASVASSDSPSSSGPPTGGQHGGGGGNDERSFRSDSHASPEQRSTTSGRHEQHSADGGAPPIKRRRIQQACKSCSFRRVKCNGQCPCQTCIKNGDECVYGLAKKRGPAKGTTRGGKKAGGVSRDMDRASHDDRRTTQSDALPRQHAVRDAYIRPPPCGDQRMTGVAATDSQVMHYDPSVAFTDAAYDLPPVSRREGGGSSAWNDAPRRPPPPPFAQQPTLQPYTTYPTSNGAYGPPLPPPPPSHGPMPMSYHASREATGGYAGQPWPAYPASQPSLSTGYSAPLPQPPPTPPMPHSEYAVPQLPREFNPAPYASSPRSDAAAPRRAPPPPPPPFAVLSAPSPSTEARSLAALPIQRDSPSSSSNGGARYNRASTAPSPRPSHLVPPGPSMHQQPNRNNPDRITRKADVNSDELADLVLAQVYHERQQARNSKANDDAPPANQKEDWSAFSGAATAANNADPQLENAPAVTDEIKDRLFQVFWNVTSLHWPMFPRQRFPSIADFRAHIEDRHPLLVNAIFSISALTWDMNRDGGKLDSRADDEALSTRELSTIFSLRAHYHHIAAVLAPTLESTAAMVLLSLRETGAGRPSQAAHYCWTACRMAMDLSLHRHAEMAQIMGAAFTPGHDEMRRRIYWSVYVIDKMMAVQLGRPPVLRDGESDCPLPSFAGDEAVYTWSSLPRNFFSDETNRKMGPQPLTVATYFTNGCRLACISEGIIAQYNVVKYKQSGGSATVREADDWQDGVARLHGRLEEWQRNTPANLQWESKAAESYFPFVIHQQVWAQACKILLHRPYILKPTDPATGVNSHAQCGKATDAICQMFIKHKELYGLRRVPSSMVYCLFSAATIALANTTSTDASVSGKAKQQLTFCVEWFIDMMETWASATQHLAILQNLASTIKVNLSETGLQGEALHETLQQKMNAQGGTAETALSAPGSAAVVASSGGGMWAASSLSSSSRPLADASGGGAAAMGSGVVSSPASGLPWTSTQSNADAAAAAAAATTLQSSGASDAVGGAESSSITTVEGATPGGGGGGGGGGHDSLQSLDAFWPDMPLGEDFQRWLSFTHTYFTVLGNANANGGSGAEKAADATTATMAGAAAEAGDDVQSKHALPPPTSSDSFYPLAPFVSHSST